MNKLYLIILTVLLSSIFSIQTVYSQCNPPNALSNMEILNLMNIPACWNITEGDEDVPVCVFDSYFDGQHCDLEDKVIEFIGNCNAAAFLPNNDIGISWNHGDQSCGAIAAIRDNDICIEGTGGENTLVAAYCEPASDGVLLDAMERGYNILSVSSWWTDEITRAGAIELHQNDVVTLVAGLDDHHQDYQDVPGIIHVGRAWVSGNFRQYSGQRNLPNTNLDLLVITQRLNRLAEGGFCDESLTGGTSLGTPMLAGVVAMMRTLSPCLFPEDIEEILVSTSGPIQSVPSVNTTRGGVLNALAALQATENFIGKDVTLGFSQVIDFQNVSGNLTIEAGAVITVDEEGRLQTGNNSIVTISANSTLDVRGEMRLGEGSKIIVKKGGRLYVNGGTLTSRCSDYWDGIIVEGSSTSQALGHSSTSGLGIVSTGLVSVTNGATIENARTAISTNPSHLPKAQQASHYGGVIFISNSHFLNNKRAIEFMPYGRDDISRITGSNFVGHEIAITGWSNFGVVIDNCYFGEYRQNAFYTIDASYELTNSRFNGGGIISIQDASIEASYTGSRSHSWRIGVDGGNNFFSGTRGVYVTSPNNNIPLQVENNIFQCMNFALTVDGVSDYQLLNNEFYNIEDTGQEVISTGRDNANISDLNYHHNNTIGITARFDNSSYRFNANCFNSGGIDFVLNGHWANLGIVNNQGIAGGVSASNEFSRFWGNNRSINLASASANAFAYLITEGTPLASRLHPNYQGTDDIALLDRPRDCHATTWICTPPVPFSIESGGNQEETLGLQIGRGTYDRNALLAELLSYQTQITNLQQTTATEHPTDAGYYDWVELQGHMNERLKTIVYHESYNDEYTYLMTTIRPFGFVADRYILGALMEELRYAEAAQLLQSMVGQTEEQQDYLYAQSVNLDRLSSPNYEVSETTLQTLRDIVEKHHPLGGKAHAVYHALTGEHVLCTHELEIEEDPIDQRVNEFVEEQYIIFPNPAKDELFITGAENISRIEFRNLQGKQVYSQQDYKGEAIELKDIESGIYFISLYNGQNERIEVMKFTKL